MNKRLLSLAVIFCMMPLFGGAVVRVDENVSLEELNTREFAPGTHVLFKRGGVWRGQLIPRSGEPGAPVVYGAYGEGAKPCLQPSQDKSDPAYWTEFGAVGSGLWQTRMKRRVDIGNVVVNGTTPSESHCGFKKGSLVQLVDDLDFWYDPKKFVVVMKSAAHPAHRFCSIELCETIHCVNEKNAHDVVYDGLHLRYAGAHGIGGANVKRITVRNCDISWIGGGYLYFDKAGRGVRYGNGIEFWSGCEDVLVESNRVWEVWDAALTNQSNQDDVLQKNIVWRDNEVWNCEYSYEYWQQGDNARTGNVVVEGNRFRDAGKGWGHRQRWNPNAAHLMFYDTTAETKGFVIRNNIFSRSENTLFRFFNDWRKNVTFSNNTWIAEGESLCRFHGRPTANLIYKYPDRLDQMHDDNQSEIESQTVSQPRVFGANERSAFSTFLGECR